MVESRREVEIKLPYDSPSTARQRLEALGAELVHERQFEDNVLFDRRLDPLEPAGKLLRLRREGSRALLTYKEKVRGDHVHKVRLEEESDVADPGALERILSGLGFSPRYRYQKFRTLFALDRLLICLDETPIGCFVELEGEPREIDRVAGELGFTRDRYVVASYLELHERWAERNGTERGDLVFEAADEDG